MPFQKGHKINVGRKRSKETQIKLNGVWLGRKHSIKSREKMSKSHKGRKLSEETKKKMRGKIREKGSAWKGGKFITYKGYIMIYKPDHPFATKNGYVRESRLIVEFQIGRYLTKEEVVHHLEEKTNPNPSFLMAFTSNSAHRRFHGNPDNINPKEIIFDGRLLNPTLL